MSRQCWRIFVRMCWSPVGSEVDSSSWPVPIKSSAACHSSGRTSSSPPSSSLNSISMLCNTMVALIRVKTVSKLWRSSLSACGWTGLLHHCLAFWKRQQQWHYWWKQSLLEYTGRGRSIAVVREKVWCDSKPFGHVHIRESLQGSACFFSCGHSQWGLIGNMETSYHCNLVRPLFVEKKQEETECHPWYLLWNTLAISLCSFSSGHWMYSLWHDTKALTTRTR